LAAEIRERYPDARVDLFEGSGGVFEVTRDGALIFSKRQLRRHAASGEVMALLASGGSAN
jgi:selT/selW/selH-like putative selenoprotein